MLWRRTQTWWWRTRTMSVTHSPSTCLKRSSMKWFHWNFAEVKKPDQLLKVFQSKISCIRKKYSTLRALTFYIFEHRWGGMGGGRGFKGYFLKFSKKATPPSNFVSAHGRLSICFELWSLLFSCTKKNYLVSTNSNMHKILFFIFSQRTISVTKSCRQFEPAMQSWPCSSSKRTWRGTESEAPSADFMPRPLLGTRGERSSLKYLVPPSLLNSLWLSSFHV